MQREFLDLDDLFAEESGLEEKGDRRPIRFQVLHLSKHDQGTSECTERRTLQETQHAVQRKDIFTVS